MERHSSVGVGGRDGVPLFALCSRSLFACLVSGAIWGCGGGSNVRNPFEADQELVHIQVLNRNFADATLHSVVTGSRRRLGRVNGHGSATFRLDWPHTRPLRIEIDLLAGQSCVTRELNVVPGDVVQLQIEPNLRSGVGCLLRRER